MNGRFKSSIAWLIAAAVLLSIGFALGADEKTAGANPDRGKFTTKELPLPGAAGLVTLDYFAYDPAHQRLWVPAGNLGAVDVIDARTDQITPISGFHTAPYEIQGRRGMLGPSSVSVGDSVIYVGNRADSSICVLDAATQKLGECISTAAQVQFSPPGNILNPRRSTAP